MIKLEIQILEYFSVFLKSVFPNNIIDKVGLRRLLKAEILICFSPIIPLLQAQVFSIIVFSYWFSFTVFVGYTPLNQCFILCSVLVLMRQGRHFIEIFCPQVGKYLATSTTPTTTTSDQTVREPWLELELNYRVPTRTTGGPAIWRWRRTGRRPGEREGGKM